MPEEKPNEQLLNIPRHVAIIMDGNGRWAVRRHLPRIAGHRAGTENLRQVIKACVEFGVEVLTIYAFSTENWKRPQDEVDGLMQLLGEAVEKELNELHRQGTRLIHFGRLEQLKYSNCCRYWLPWTYDEFCKNNFIRRSSRTGYTRSHWYKDG